LLYRAALTTGSCGLDSSKVVGFLATWDQHQREESDHMATTARTSAKTDAKTSKTAKGTKAGKAPAKAEGAKKTSKAAAPKKK